MGLTLLAGPANAGKVALLLERYLAELQHEPILIVPNRSDIDGVERELLRHRGALLTGWIGTFDDLFERIARGNGGQRPVATEAQRALIVRKAVERLRTHGLGRSARTAGFSDTLSGTISELEAGLLDPDALEGDLRHLYAAYRGELDRLGLWDRDRERRYAAERVAGELGAWHGEPVFAYGFEDLTGAQWMLLEALAGRTDVTVSLPYEPGRPAFASLRRTAQDLGELTAGPVEELPARYGEFAHPALAQLERGLFAETPPQTPTALDGAIRFLEGAGSRGVLELVGNEVLELIRAGTAPEQIAVVCPSVERWRAPIETAFGSLGVPHSIEDRVRLGQTPLGHALLALLRFEWLGGSRSDLYAYLRSPYSGVPRRSVDFAEGRLRGRAIDVRERVEEETERLRGAGVPVLEELRSAGSPVVGIRAVAAAMLRAAYGLESPPADEGSRQDLRTHDAVLRLFRELEGWERLDGTLSQEEVVAALERTTVRAGAAGEPGRVAVLDLLKARTRRFEVVFVLGLEEGSLPRRTPASPFLGEDTRRQLGGRLLRPDGPSRDRYLFYTACTRPSRRLYLAREAATDEGTPREPSPFWEEVRALFPTAELERWTFRRPLSAFTWRLEEAPTERERLRALALLADGDQSAAEGLAAANGWGRRLRRAVEAFDRPTELRNPAVLARLQARTTVNVTELERFADCSSAWFVERLLDPKTIDADVDAKLRGSVAHTALHKFFSGLGRELGSERVESAQVEDAARFMRRCLDQALAGVRMEMTEMQRRELDQGLWRDLEQLVREEAASELPLVPRRFEVSFGSEKRSAPELQRGLELDGVTLSGKIDRVDVDPFSARGIVQDYKSGRHAHSAAEIERELRLQVPLYMLVLRDLIGIEPLGGIYKPLAGDRKGRGLLRAEARDEGLPGFVKADYLDEEAFWAQIESAKETAEQLAGRMRAGDIRHDPRGGECPTWCQLWPMCRVKRA
jgi:ATP-dependent helicase/nuclease subunit B